MPARSPEDRALIARIANTTRLAKTADHSTLTEKARAARRAQFEQRALGDNPHLTGDALARAADEYQRAHMLRMTLKARQARRQVRDATRAALAAQAEMDTLGGAAS
jgi:hypothetical protein